MTLSDRSRAAQSPLSCRRAVHAMRSTVHCGISKPSVAESRHGRRPASPNPVPAPEAQNPAPSVAAVRATARPSFDCRQARNNAERSICSDPGLADLDVQMARRYARMQNNIDGRPAEILRDEQRAWLRRRDACATSACIRALYETRAATMGR